MDLRVSAFSAAYQTPQVHSQRQAAVAASTSQAAASSANVTANDLSRLQTRSDNTSKATTSPIEERQARQREALKDPSKVAGQDALQKPGVVVEYDQQGQRVTKVNDNKGMLIYQVPSKGQLALIEASEKSRPSQLVATA